MSEAVWKPEVGKTAWAVRGNSVQHVEITKISGDMVWNTSKGWGEVWTVPFGLFPTAEAALASIKVYDLEGNEVVVSRAEPDLDVEADFAEFVSSDQYIATKYLEWCGIDVERVVKDGKELINRLMADVKTRFPEATDGEKPTDERVESDC